MAELQPKEGSKSGGIMSGSKILGIERKYAIPLIGGAVLFIGWRWYSTRSSGAPVQDEPYSYDPEPGAGTWFEGSAGGVTPEYSLPPGETEAPQPVSVAQWVTDAIDWLSKNTDGFVPDAAAFAKVFQGQEVTQEEATGIGAAFTFLDPPPGGAPDIKVQNSGPASQKPADYAITGLNIAEATKTSIAVSFTPPKNISGIGAQIKSRGTGAHIVQKTTVGPTATQWRATGLKPGTTYTIGLRARPKNNTSAPAAEITANTLS